MGSRAGPGRAVRRRSTRACRTPSPAPRSSRPAPRAPGPRRSAVCGRAERLAEPDRLHPCSAAASRPDVLCVGTGYPKNLRPRLPAELVDRPRASVAKQHGHLTVREPGRGSVALYLDVVDGRTEERVSKGRRGWRAIPDLEPTDAFAGDPLAEWLGLILASSRERASREKRSPRVADPLDRLLRVEVRRGYTSCSAERLSAVGTVSASVDEPPDRSASTTASRARTPSPARMSEVEITLLRR